MGGERPVLVLTHDFDPTADMVVDELNRRGVPIFRCNPGAFPRRLTLAATVSGGWVGSLRLPERELLLEQVRCVYYRRPTVFELPDGLSDAEHRWALREARAGFGGLVAALPRWLNHPHDIAYAEYKPIQLQTAVTCGLRIPPTLITNDPTAAAQFAAAVGPVVYKPLAQNWIAEHGRYRTLFATVLDRQPDASTIRSTAHLFQQRVEKLCEVRLTVVDECLLAARIDAHSASASVDWRSDYDNLTYSVIPVPDPVRAGVLALMRALRLRFGAFDFIVSPANEWLFLEVNANGQWGWIEDNAGLPIAATIAEALTKE